MTSHSPATINLTFSQREGLVGVPEPLRLRQVSKELRALLWAAVYGSIKRHQREHHIAISEPWRSICESLFVEVAHGAIDDFNSVLDVQVGAIRSGVMDAHYNVVFDIIEFCLKHPSSPPDLAPAVAEALLKGRAAYVLVDRKAFFPAATPEEAATLTRALEDLGKDGFAGARKHLLEAGSCINGGDYAGSVRESVHAVVSVARKLEPKAKTLEPALAALERKNVIHGALKSGFASMYGYSSDEQGIRHELLDKDAAKVDQTDALFMLGASAAFVSYLIAKGREAGLL